jgi:hypothetical protein
MSQVPFVLPPDDLQVLPQCLLDFRGQHGHAVLLSLAVAYQEFTACKIDVLDAQLQAFEQPQSGPVQ